jgi:hypothetical protein
MKQNTLNWLSYSLIFLFLFSCKKKDDFLPLKTGKYKVQYSIIHSNGNADVTTYEAYGPKLLASKYVFDIKLTDSTDLSEASIFYSEKKLSHFTWITHYSVSNVTYKITSYDCSKETLTIQYISDTVSGTITFNLLEE